MDRIFRRMKVLIIIVLIFIYCLSMSAALYYIGNNKMEFSTIGLLTHSPMLFLILSMLLFRGLTKSTHTEKQLYLIADFMIVSFLFLYCLNNKGWLSGVTMKLLTFNGLNVVFIVIVLTNGLRHGIFKNK